MNKYLIVIVILVILFGYYYYTFNPPVEIPGISYCHIGWSGNHCHWVTEQEHVH